MKLVILHTVNYHLQFLLIETTHISILHYTPQISYILTYVRVVLATSEVQSILEIAATDEIHMEDRNQTCMSTATIESCGTRTTNGRINLYIKLEKHNLDQIADRNIRTSLD